MGNNENKKIICRCNDVTEEEVIKAIDKGYKDIESLKRYLHIGMGPCQGRVCISLVQSILAKKTNKRIEEIGLPVTRPPIIPVLFKVLLSAVDMEEVKNEK